MRKIKFLIQNFMDFTTREIVVLANTVKSAFRKAKREIGDTEEIDSAYDFYHGNIVTEEDDDQ